MQAAEKIDQDWIEVGALDDIPRLGARVLETDTLSIALFRTSTDQVYALRDRCPHKGGPLSQGIVYGHTVACPLHNWCVDMNKGEAIAPDEGCVPTYPVKVEDNSRVFLSLTPLGDCLGGQT